MLADAYLGGRRLLNLDALRFSPIFQSIATVMITTITTAVAVGTMTTMTMTTTTTTMMMTTIVGAAVTGVVTETINALAVTAVQIDVGHHAKEALEVRQEDHNATAGPH